MKNRSGRKDRKERGQEEERRGEERSGEEKRGDNRRQERREGRGQADGWMCDDSPSFDVTVGALLRWCVREVMGEMIC